MCNELACLCPFPMADLYLLALCARSCVGIMVYSFPLFVLVDRMFPEPFRLGCKMVDATRAAPHLSPPNLGVGVTLRVLFPSRKPLATYAIDRRRLINSKLKSSHLLGAPAPSPYLHKTYPSCALIGNKAVRSSELPPVQFRPILLHPENTSNPRITYPCIGMMFLQRSTRCCTKVRILRFMRRTSSPAPSSGK